MSNDAKRPSQPPPSVREDGSNRPSRDRVDVAWPVDYAVDVAADDTFLYSSIANISEMGIFVRSLEPLALGTKLVLGFAPPGHEAFRLAGEVTWINPVRPGGDNPNPGMGIRFLELTPENRERLVEVVRTIAYVREPD